MGYDYTIDYRTEPCPTCKRGESGQLYDGYLSYNHSWVFRKYLDKDEGFRQLYSIPLPEVIKKIDIILDKLREDYPDEYLNNYSTQENWVDGSVGNEHLEMVTNIHGSDVRYDGWATTVGNVYLHLRELMVKCKELVLDGYEGATIYGD